MGRKCKSKETLRTNRYGAVKTELYTLRPKEAELWGTFLFYWDQVYQRHTRHRVSQTSTASMDSSLLLAAESWLHARLFFLKVRR
ncbi:hypothetical protein TNCT_266281 [Trichonephila clavata]|uniref:Uncharacterized protein n=1 Tax=Trichonephila clavata TaxID=2740835 RepID=A0A8X6FTV4_TRICU|nr:hypothetical protein TNCT_266281 [Trichonephila clavata]